MASLFSPRLACMKMYLPLQRRKNGHLSVSVNELEKYLEFSFTEEVVIRDNL